MLNLGFCHLPNASSRTSQLTGKFRFLTELSTIYSLKILPSLSSIMYTCFQGSFTGQSLFLYSPLSCQLLEGQGGIRVSTLIKLQHYSSNHGISKWLISTWNPRLKSSYLSIIISHIPWKKLDRPSDYCCLVFSPLKWEHLSAAVGNYKPSGTGQEDSNVLSDQMFYINWDS